MIISLADRLKEVKTYYFVEKLEQIRSLQKEGKDVINFGIGSPDLPPSEEAIKALIDTSVNSDSHGYQPYKGLPELRESIENWYLNTYGIDLSPHKEVLPLMGSKEGILHISLAFCNPGDKVLIPDPGYPTYASLPKLLGCEVVKYNLKEELNWYPDFEELEKIDTEQVKIMFINYPHMPTGTPARMDVFQKLVAFARKRNILLVHDNPYSLVLNKEKPVSIFQVDGAKDVAVELNSFSKSHNMAGWRIGVLLGAEDYVNAALKVKSNIDSGMFKGIQAAAVAALQVEDFWHDERNEVYSKRRDGIYKILDYLGFEYSTEQEGMFVWAKPKEAMSVTEIKRYIDSLLLEKNIFITPGFIFGANGEGFIRLSLCVPEDRVELAYKRLSS